MEAKELMVGDWYNISADGISINKRVDCFFFCEWVTHVFMHPIPLTSEILELNGVDGYKHGINELCKCHPNSMGEYFQFEYTFDKKVMLSMSFEYVHELQHALRLCGLGELADNFKVEKGE